MSEYLAQAVTALSLPREKWLAEHVAAVEKLCEQLVIHDRGVALELLSALKAAIEKV